MGSKLHKMWEFSVLVSGTEVRNIPLSVLKLTLQLQMIHQTNEPVI